MKCILSKAEITWLTWLIRNIPLLALKNLKSCAVKYKQVLFTSAFILSMPSAVACTGSWHFSQFRWWALDHEQVIFTSPSFPHSIGVVEVHNTSSWVSTGMLCTLGSFFFLFKVLYTTKSTCNLPGALFYKHFLFSQITKFSFVRLPFAKGLHDSVVYVQIHWAAENPTVRAL